MTVSSRFLQPAAAFLLASVAVIAGTAAQTPQSARGSEGKPAPLSRTLRVRGHPLRFEPGTWLTSPLRREWLQLWVCGGLCRSFT